MLFESFGDIVLVLMSNRGKLIVLGGVTFLTAAAAFTTIYLPFYSEDAIRRQEQLKANGGRATSGTPTRGGTRGSMWGNIDKENTPFYYKSPYEYGIPGIYNVFFMRGVESSRMVPRK